MKLYALVFLVAVCAFENVTADWRTDITVSHSKNIDNIVNKAINQLQQQANAKGNHEARECSKLAKVGLRVISLAGYRKIAKCAAHANNQNDANICAQDVEAKASKKVANISASSSDCIKQAH